MRGSRYTGEERNPTGGSTYERRGYGYESGSTSRERNFFGVGPRGYLRPDARIAEEVCDVLTADPHVDASEIEVTVSQGEVTLQGAVDDRRLKYYIEDRLMEIPGVKDVHNYLRARYGNRAGPSREEF